MKFASALAFALGAATAYAQCPSGQIGEPCVDGNFTGCLLPFPSSDPLITTPIAELMSSKSGFLQTNNFTLAIEANPYVGRTMTSIQLGFSQNSVCTYPGPNFVKGFSQCRDTYTGVISFQDLVQNCGFSLTPFDASHEAYNGYVTVSTTDQIGQLRGVDVTRTSSSRLAVSLVLQNTFNANVTGINVYSEIGLEAAIVEQEYDVTTDTATIVLKTSVQYPYQLTSVAFSSFPLGLGVEPQPTSPNCPQNNPCVVDYTFTISGVQSAGCSLDGDYSINIGYTCNNNFILPADCPVSGSPTVGLNFTLQSGDVCPKFAVTSSIAANMDSYSDNTYAAKRISFIAGQTAFFKISVEAAVNIDFLEITDLSFNDYIVIESGTAVTPPVTISYTAPTQPNSNDIVFSLELGVGPGELLEPNGPDATLSFNVLATVVVHYKTTFKRDSLSEDLKIGQTVVVDISKFKSIPMEVDSASISYVTPLALVAAGALALNF